VKHIGKQREGMEVKSGAASHSKGMDIPSQGWLRVISAAHAMLEQCEAFVRDVPGSVYASESQVLPGGTVGKHLRHVLDHYAAIVECIDCAAEVDYDHRDRDTPMETDRDAAMARLAGLRERVAGLTRVSEATSVRVRVMVTSDGGEALLASSVARELAFATHHAVHHQAMMKAIAGEFGVEAGPEFGKAPSTINHELMRR
jgi:uncharacterized damage-inducible protein DinB